MNHVIGLEREVHHPTLGQIQLVRGDDRIEFAGWAPHRELRISELPPPLMADDLDLQGVAPRLALRAENRAHGWDGDEDEDQRGNDRPRDLEGRVAVHMFRLPRRGTATEAHERVDQYGFDDDEYDRSEPDQDLKEKSDVAIGVCAIVKDGVRILAAGGNDDRGGRQRYRQRGTSEPARAEFMMHCAVLFSFVRCAPFDTT